jgi:hypothetical protein
MADKNKGKSSRTDKELTASGHPKRAMSIQTRATIEQWFSDNCVCNHRLAPDRASIVRSTDLSGAASASVHSSLFVFVFLSPR